MSARPFTGRHMLASMLGFFGIVIAVNFTMAWFASSTFGGTVVDNSYVASQKFNGWLEQSRKQAALGWTPALSLDANRYPVLTVTIAGAPQPGFTATGSAHHPLGRAPDVPMVFDKGADGALVSRFALPPGRWYARITIAREGQVMRIAETLQ
jgi:nitrogen fixation protein FixH